MELQSLGKYRLVSPMPVTDASCRFFLARHSDEPDDEPPSYVVKLLMPGHGPAGVRRRAQFEHETRLLQAFNHASLPTAHAAGEQDGVPYIVMDRIEGTTLGRLLWRRTASPQPLAKEVAIYVLAQLADAVHHIHGVETMEDSGPELLRVVHRNINPSHILLSVNGDALLCGFGSATSRWLARTHDDPAAGDLAYFAPERLTGTPADPLTDLFSLAVVLWEMLKGQRCLAGETETQTRDNIMRFDIAQSGRRVSGLSSKLSEVLRKNLDRDPGRRYTGAYQMLQRLAQAPEAQAAESARQTLADMVRQTMARTTN